MVRTTLGSKGMDKMIVDSIGEVIVTNDGVTILEEMQIEHPVLLKWWLKLLRRRKILSATERLPQ